MACSTDPLGGACSDNEEDIYKTMDPRNGNNFISQHPANFINCESFICLSTNGSKPYCTKRCTSDTECQGATSEDGNPVDMVCTVVTEFGALACRNPKNEYCAGENIEADDLCCEQDPQTQSVVDPAKYCAAKDGQIPHDPAADVYTEEE